MRDPLVESGTSSTARSSSSTGCASAVGGILGDSTKPGRRDEREFVRELKRVIAGAPDIVVLHHPDGISTSLRSAATIAAFRCAAGSRS